MRFALLVAAVALVALPAAAPAQHCCGHRARTVALVMPVSVAPVAPLSYTPTVAVSYAPVAVAAPTYASFAPVQYAPVQITSLAVAAPYATGYAPTYAPSYAAPVGCTGGPVAPTMPRAVATGDSGDINDTVAKLAVAVGQLTRIVQTHTDVLTEHQTALRAIEARTGALERKASVPAPR